MINIPKINSFQENSNRPLEQTPGAPKIQIWFRISKPSTGIGYVPASGSGGTPGKCEARRCLGGVAAGLRGLVGTVTNSVARDDSQGKPETNLFMVPMFLDATFRMCPFLVSLHTCLRISCLFYHDFMTFQPFQPQNILVESRYQSKAVGVSAESTYPQLAKHTMEFESPHRDLMTGEPGFLWSEWDSSPRNCWWTFAT